MVLLGTTLPAVGAIVRLAKVQPCSAQTRSVERLTIWCTCQRYQFMTTVTKLFCSTWRCGS
uniref:Uncharacterized protein n=1 Tax=Brassica campestris TaxID=3711 RepID=A0A3P6BF47_BRACM|nr:unnamed protein product [Brassica rapa]